MSAYTWPRSGGEPTYWRSDSCRHKHRSREAAERCESPVTHWLVGDALTACGLNLAGRYWIAWSSANNETDCRRCLSAHVDLDAIDE